MQVRILSWAPIFAVAEWYASGFAVTIFGSNPMKIAYWNASGCAVVNPGSIPGCERKIKILEITVDVVNNIHYDNDVDGKFTCSLKQME